MCFFSWDSSGPTPHMADPAPASGNAQAQCAKCAGRMAPQYALQPVMHTASYASALKGPCQPCVPRQLSAAAPEFIPYNARPLQDVQPLMSAR